MSDTQETKTLYCAGKMRGEPDMGFPKFDEAANQLRLAGYNVVSPAELDRRTGKKPSELDRANCLRRDLRMLMTCDGIALLENWLESPGARLEIHVADELGLPYGAVSWWLEQAEPDPPELVGLTGYAGAGKDEVAAALRDRLGYTRVAFADPLKEMLYHVNPIADWNPVISVKHMVDFSGGWEHAKTYPEVRHLLQRLGVAGRDILGEDVWVNTALAHADDALGAGGRVVIPDVRFENEVDAIKHEGGVIVHICRAGKGPVNEHESEKLAGRIERGEVEVDGWISNGDTLAELHRNAVDAVRELA